MESDGRSPYQCSWRKHHPLWGLVSLVWRDALGNRQALFLPRREPLYVEGSAALDEPRPRAEGQRHAGQ